VSPICAGGSKINGWEPGTSITFLQRRRWQQRVTRVVSLAQPTGHQTGERAEPGGTLPSRSVAREVRQSGVWSTRPPTRFAGVATSASDDANNPFRRKFSVACSIRTSTDRIKRVKVWQHCYVGNAQLAFRLCSIPDRLRQPATSSDVCERRLRSQSAWVCPAGQGGGESPLLRVSSSPPRGKLSGWCAART